MHHPHHGQHTHQYSGGPPRSGELLHYNRHARPTLEHGNGASGIGPSLRGDGGRSSSELEEQQLQPLLLQQAAQQQPQPHAEDHGAQELKAAAGEGEGSRHRQALWGWG